MENSTQPPKKVITLYLTDLMPHAKEFRIAKTLEKTIKKDSNGINRGRLYANHALKVEKDGTWSMPIVLPEELQEQVNRGEVEVRLAIPKKGLPMFASPDAIEALKKMQKKERNLLIHNNQKRTWRKENKI